MVAQPALEGSTAVVVLHAIGLEGFNFPRVSGDHELHDNLALRRQEQLGGVVMLQSHGHVLHTLRSFSGYSSSWRACV